VSLTGQQLDFFRSLGPITHDPSAELTLDRVIATEAASFLAACRLELGWAPWLADPEEAIRAEFDATTLRHSLVPR
jgi:hypothetical protein